MAETNVPKGFYLLEGRFIPIPGAIFRFKNGGVEYQVGEVGNVGETIELKSQDGHVIDANYITDYFHPERRLWSFERMGWTGAYQVVEVKPKTESEAPRGKYEKGPMKYTKIVRDHFHYTEWEKKARNFEASGDLVQAKLCRINSNKFMAIDKVMDAQEKAMDEGNAILTEDFRQLSKADQDCWKARGLNVFQHYTVLGFWYENK